jgi:hypothetical protein
MDAATRVAVRRRADSRCEYCRLHQADDPFFTFHVEHIIARQHGGTDDLDNLALACHWCNLHKGPNLSGIDPQSGRQVTLFHPRRQQWRRHFRWDGARIIGRTRSGRATVAVLNVNADVRVVLRETLITAGRFPPP